MYIRCKIKTPMEGSSVPRRLEITRCWALAGSGRLRMATTKEPPTATRVKDKAEGEEIVAATKKKVKREGEW